MKISNGLKTGATLVLTCLTTGAVFELATIGTRALTTDAEYVWALSRMGSTTKKKKRR